MKVQCWEYDQSHFTHVSSKHDAILELCGKWYFAGHSIVSTLPVHLHITHATQTIRSWVLLTTLGGQYYQGFQFSPYNAHQICLLTKAPPRRHKVSASGTLKDIPGCQRSCSRRKATKDMYTARLVLSHMQTQSFSSSATCMHMHNLCLLV